MFFVILFIHIQSFTINSNISTQNRQSWKKEKSLDGSQEALQRKSRDAANTSNEGLECLSCYADGISATDENCYKGSGVSTQKCLDAEKCYIELHPLYIKRGCVLPGSLNRTFVCKCPLCNDKPSYDPAYYEYTKLSDWEYDNERLKKPLMSVSLMCKVCETKGVNNFLDNICKSGLRTKSKVCARGQYCFINIDEQTDFVSRGCISEPVYNKFYKFCDESNCNRIPFHNIKRHNPYLKTLQMTRVSSQFSSSVGTSNIIFIYFIVLEIF
ncbi:uncharacterized protein LOC101738688 isoform X5 [Bombyx mori]|uniref:Uncharacterized protein n=1 Tax=Bombyx mori TaxID=7091 RepID=A0A8R2HLU6_BOMMO|nr:uncharacterized protein LOC101738688 isoform X5 [Bombyx mori]